MHGICDMSRKVSHCAAHLVMLLGADGGSLMTTHKRLDGLHISKHVLTLERRHIRGIRCDCCHKMPDCKSQSHHKCHTSLVRRRIN